MHALKWDLWFELLIKFLCLIKTKKSKYILTGVENNFKKILWNNWQGIVIYFRGVKPVEVEFSSFPGKFCCFC